MVMRGPSTVPIPEFPGQRPSRGTPAPPKYLLISDSAGNEKRIEVAPRGGTAAPAASRGPSSTAQLMPVKLKQPEGALVQTRFTSSEPVPRTYDQPAHRFKPRLVDSKSEGKSDDSRAPPMKFVGTSYANAPNAPHRGYTPRPLAPAIPRPFVPTPAAAFADGPMLHNRTAAGVIMGSLSTRRYVEASHVPYYEPDVPIGPDNPTKQIDEIWSGHWDDEAGAVYYYNQVTGEATWLPPS